jgi:asparagine synthase (glutamine-hydrolysing)
LSAFAGLVRFDGAGRLATDVARMARGLPQFDGGRPSSWASHHAALTHKLFVITPEDRLERQPWIGHDGQSRLVFAGRLDNREEVAAALGWSSERLAGSADGALCLAALERWEEAAPARLIGGFAFALWDESRRRLLLARDPMGGRPLFYHRGRQGLAFATSFNALFALPEIPRALDEAMIAELLLPSTMEQTRTLYQDIIRVPSGCLAVADAEGIRVEHYWTPQRRALGLRSHDDCVEAAREQLDRATRPMLRSETQVAVQCSGGLDSPAVAATAARLLAPARLTLVTRVPAAGHHPADTAKARFDEGPAVRALAAMHRNMDLILVDDDGLHPVDLDPAMRFAINGIPVFNPLNHGWFSGTVDRVRSGGHRVLLDGGWGNLTLGWGQKSSLHADLLSRSPLRVLRELLAIARVTERPFTRVLRQHVLRKLEPEWSRRWRRGSDTVRPPGGFLNRDYWHDHGQRLVENRALRFGRMDPDPFVARSRMLIRSNEIGRDWTGQAPAFLGHEKRDPLGDPRLIEFCLNVPESHYLRNGWPRALIRDAIADRTPPEIHANLKFGVQDAEWFHRLGLQREAIAKDVERFASSPLAARVIDIPRMRALLADWPADAAAAQSRKNDLANGLTRATQIGRFICWVEGVNG